jgi:glycosyltransferase involved in cell wall biosynthesis
MSDRRPHVCFVAPHAYLVLAEGHGVDFMGGAELQQVLVARGLVERGYRVSMICLDFGQDDNVKVHGITVLRAFRPDDGIPILRFLWPRLTKLWLCLRRADADIYYQRTAGMLTGVVAAFCQLAGKRSIFAAAGNPDLEKDTSRIRYWRDRRIFEYGVRHVDQVLVQNEEQARLCRTNYGREPILVPNCYPLHSVTGVGPTGHILWTSTLRKLKRPDLFLDLAQALPELRFRMVGGPASGEHALFESIRSRAEELPNVEFVGFVPYAQIDDHFEKAALFVNTSESEGFPNTFLQAWSRGIPTISFIDAGARLDGEPVGLVVRSLEEMKVAINRLLTHTDRYMRLRERSSKYLEKNHAPMGILDRYETIFRGMGRQGVSE